MGVVTLLVQRSVGAVVSLETLPLSARVANALVASVAYIAAAPKPVPIATTATVSSGTAPSSATTPRSVDSRAPVSRSR